MDKEKVMKLYRWLHENGGALQDGVEIVYHPSYGYHLQALAEFKVSNPVVYVPQSLTISISTLSYAQSQWPQDFIDRYADEPYVVSRFLLLDEYLHGASSWWCPYISLLPQVSEDLELPAFTTPPWFSDEDLTWLKGTGLPAAVEQRIKLWRKEYEEGRKFLTRLAKYDGYSWLLYKWAATILSSRCFPSETPQGQKSEDHSVQGSTEKRPDNEIKRVASHPVLVPVLDLANHKPNVKVTWIINENGYSLFTSEKPGVSSQIFNNYGAKGNEELLMGYGFTIPDNTADSLGIKFTIPDCSQKKCIQTMIKEGRNLPLRLSPTQLSLETISCSEFSSAPDVFYLQVGIPVPATLMDTLRLMIANERELKDLYNGKDTTISNRLTIQSNGQLLIALVERHNLLNESIALSGSIPTNIRQKISQEYLYGQSGILIYHIKLLFNDLSKVQQSNKIWTLQTILQSSPDITRCALRGLSRSVCGTRDSTKLKAKGLEDALMTIFICLNWLAFSTNDPTTDSENETNQDLTNWHTFLLSTYCPPPSNTKVGNECKSVNCFHPTPSIQPWSISDPGPDRDPDPDPKSSIQISTAYSIIQRYFLTSSPDPIFDSVDVWSKQFLSWGLGVWNAEGVTVPVASVRDEIELGRVISLEMERGIVVAGGLICGELVS